MGSANRRDNGIAAMRPLVTAALTDETTIAHRAATLEMRDVRLIAGERITAVF